jgi:3-dehydroquinate synthase
VTVEAEPRVDTLRVATGLLARAGEVLRELGLRGRAFVIAPDDVLPLHGDKLLASLERAGYEPAARAVPASETSKSLAMATQLYEWLADQKAERRDFVVALGGGMVGDLAGFVAATYLRGIAVVQAPTTLLSQVDSAIGGKTAVNLERGKNLVGAFHLPRAILVDPATLATLPRREIVAGWTETIKHALIMDASLLERIEAKVDALLGLEPAITQEVVERSGRLKVGVVEEDPKEQGRRVILNYGHTIGQALEAAAGYGQYLHGEAVAIGMVGAAAIGQAVGITPPLLAERQQRLLERFGLPTEASRVDLAGLRAAMRLDKKVEARANRWVLLSEVGRTAVKNDVPDDVVEAVLRRLVTS